VGKNQDCIVVENMKKKYGLVKGNRGYNINLINDQEVHLATYIFVRKIMRKCCANGVPTSVASLAMQCANGVQHNWVGYLCKEFLEDYYEV